MSATVLREVRLYGELGRRFGRVHLLAVSTAREAARALCAVLDGFEREFLGADGLRSYHVFVGRGAARRDISENQVIEPVGATEPIRFVPVIAGAKSAGATQIILGSLLVVASIALNVWSQGALNAITTPMLKLGVILILGGVVGLISRQRQKSDPAASDTPSYAYDGPVNNTQEGGPVPLAFGRVVCGSTVISQGLSTEALVVPGATDSPAPVGRPPYEPHFPTDER
jgi:predicted phage tail protein